MKRFLCNDHDVVLVRGSWARVRLREGAFGPLFYQNLFNASPGAAALFTNGVEAQGRRLFLMVEAIVRDLPRQDQIRPTLEELGRYHAVRGIRQEHYTVFMGCLIESVAVLDDGYFAPAHRYAWARVLTMVTNTMQRGAMQTADHPEAALSNGF